MLYRHLPIRCKSVLCPYCAWVDSRERFKAIRNVLGLVREPVGFLTLTFPSFQDPVRAVEYAIEVKRKFYNFKPFGKRKWERVRREVLERLDVYLRNIGDDRERERRRRFHEWVLEEFELAWADKLYDSKDRLYMGRILRSVWKFELTYNPERGWHPHWHVLVIGYFPLFLIQAVWVACGGGEVIDLRVARDLKEVMSYVADYESKPAVELGGGVSYEMELAVEEALYGRKLFEVWGLAELDVDDEDGEFVFEDVVRGAESVLEVENLHNLPVVVRGLSRDGPIAYVGGAVIERRIWVEGDEVVLRVSAGVIVDKKGRIWLLPEENKKSWLEC